MTTFLVGDLFTFGYDKLPNRFRTQRFVPAKFTLFIFGVIVGAVFSEYVLQGLASGFNSLTPFAYGEFFMLDFVPSFLLILDFFNHEKARETSNHQRSSVRSTAVMAIIAVIVVAGMAGLAVSLPASSTVSSAATSSFTYSSATSSQSLSWQSFFLNPELAYLLISAVAAVIAAFALDFFKNRRQQGASKKSLAILLGLEIESIRRHAVDIISGNEAPLNAFTQIRNALASGGKFKAFGELGVILSEADYPTDAYQTHSAELSLFGADSASSIAELYRWVKSADHVKERVNVLVSEISDSKPRAKSDHENLSLELLTRIGEMMARHEEYVRRAETIKSLCEESLASLKKFAKADEAKIRPSPQIITLHFERPPSESADSANATDP
jgi:hypothetical protein